MQCTQTEVVYVFDYFNCDDLGSHLTKKTPIHYLNKLEYGDMPIS